MFARNFISLYFLPGKLFIAQLSSNKKKLKKHAIVGFPKDLIKNYKVEDESALANILKHTWSKFSLKEKSVGIILPEFSTFTKFFKFPALPYSELDEAIRWQAQEYLPKASKMVMDWKIANKDNDKLDALMVAVDKEILSGYVGACEKAGLFPLVVETPSICLVRSVKDSDKGNLIINFNDEESTLLVSEGQKIVGTSVIRSASSMEVEKTASKMISHYKDTKVERVLAGGSSVDEGFLSELENQLKISVEKIKLDIEGVEDKTAQEYLIPIFMQVEKPAEPADPSTLNLLPAHMVDKYKSAKTKVQVWSLTLTITLFVWISFIVTLVAYLFMAQQVNDMGSEKLQRSEKSVQREMAIKDVAMINETAQKVNKIRQAYIFPQTVLNQIENSRPRGVSLDRYDLDLDKGRIQLNGIAASRQDLIAFKQNLESYEEITTVNIPISSFETEINLEFTMSFVYQKLSTEMQAN